MTFAAYETPNDPSFRQWLMLWQSVYNPNWKIGSDDRAKLRRLNRLLDALDTVVTKTTNGNGDELSKLLREGATLSLEEAEHELLKEAWRAYIPSLPAALARDVMAINEMLDPKE